MRSLLRTVILLALVLNAGVALSSTIGGTIKDSEGAVIPKAKITVHRDSSDGGRESADVVITSEKDGQFRLEVAPGFYDVFVSAPAFSPQCAKVRVKESEPATYMPRLRADPLVVKERGDTFSN